MDGISNEKANDAVKTLVRYCLESGCLYCQYCIMDGPDIECEVRRPREWRIDDE